MRIEEHLKDVNLDYTYKDEDITQIILCRTKFLLLNNNQAFRKKIITAKPLHTTADGKLKQFLINEIKRTNEDRIILLPCYVEDDWIGLMIEIAKDNEDIQIDYLDSMLIGDAIFETIETQIYSALPKCKLQAKKCWSRSEDKEAIVYMIENLLAAAMTTPSKKVDVNIMRAYHLQSLQMFNPIYYETFKSNQFKNTPIIINSDLDETMPVEKATEELVNTVGELNSCIDELFLINNTISQAFPEKSKKLYQAVCSENGKLGLFAKDIAKERTLVKSRSAFGITEDVTGFLVDYAATEVSLAGVAISTAFRIALITNPWAMAAAAIFTLGSAVSAQEARSFAKKIQQAAELVGTNDENKLIEAKNILCAEVGEADNKSPFMKWLRSCSTPKDQVDFARLLLAHIHHQLGEEIDKQYALFQEIYESSTNEYIKCMCIVAQMTILSPNAAWIGETNNGLKREANKDMLQLNEKAKELNAQTDFVQQYFVKVLTIYKDVVDIVKNKQYVKSDANFAEIRIIIDKLQEFQDLNCLRYMKHHNQDCYGQIAELTMTFAQAVVNIIYELHYRAIDSLTNPTAVKYYDYYRAATMKFKECEALIYDIKNPHADGKINELKKKSSRANNKNSTESKIIDYIETYIAKYYEQHNIISNNRDAANEKLIANQFYCVKKQLNTQEVEQVIQNVNGLTPAQQDSLRDHYNIQGLRNAR